MAKITRFENLQCWQHAQVLANYVYDLGEIPHIAKNFRFRDQLQSAAVAVMNNIAEGFGRFGKKDFIKFLNVASSSCCEVKSMSYLLFDRKIIDQEILDELHEKINITYYKILGLIKCIRSKIIAKRMKRNRNKTLTR